MLPSVEMLPKRSVVSEEILSNPLVILSNALPFRQGGRRPSSDKFVLGLSLINEQGNKYLIN